MAIGALLDHQFVDSEEYPAQGVWFEDNGSIICRWWWEPSAEELVVRHGPDTVRQRVDLEPDETAWREQLKTTALAIARPT